MSNTTVEVIPHRVWVNVRTGEKASIYGARPPGDGWQIQQHGWTWERVSASGRVTVGLCRVPVETRGEALTIAHNYAAATGASILGDAW